MKVFQDYPVNPTVLVWGGHQRACRLAAAISRRQPVIWAAREKPPYPVDSFAGEAIWGKDLVYLRGKAGHFTAGLRGSDTDEIDIGAVVIVPGSSQPVFKYPEVDQFQHRTLLFVLMGVARGTFAEALPHIVALAAANQVWVITDDVQVGFADGETLYTKARQQGAVFIRTDRVPVAGLETDTPGQYQARVYDLALGRELVLDYDWLVAPSWGNPEHDTKYRQLLGLGPEALDLYPGQTNREGILVFPDAEGVMTEAEEAVVIQALATRVGRLAGGHVRVETYYEILADKCALCLTCYRLCPHQAVALHQSEAYDNLYQQACLIDSLSCRGCGLCYTECPAQAIEKIQDQLESGSPPLVLACENAVGPSRPLEDSNCEYQLFPCAGAIGENEILRAISDGEQAREVFLVACHGEKCQHEQQNMRLAARVKRLNRLFTTLGLSPRVTMVTFSAAEPPPWLAIKVGEKK